MDGPRFSAAPFVGYNREQAVRRAAQVATSLRRCQTALRRRRQELTRANRENRHLRRVALRTAARVTAQRAELEARIDDLQAQVLAVPTMGLGGYSLRELDDAMTALRERLNLAVIRRALGEIP